MLLTILLVVFTIQCSQAQLEKYNQSSGYVDVREGAHMFYWLFNTTAPVKDYTERPLIICLFGDPGSGVSGIANLLNFGPLAMDLTEREDTLITNFNVMFLDSPVGSGFSYVDDKKLLTKTDLEIATDFIVFTQEFYKRNPEFKSVPVYIYGRGYGAKTAVDIAIQLNNSKIESTIKSNLRGIIMENPWVSPLDHVHAWPRMLKFASLVDQKGYVKVLNAVQETERLYKSGQYDKSKLQLNKTLNSIIEAATAINFNDIFDGTFTNLSNTIELPSDEEIELVSFPEDLLEQYMNSEVKKMLKIPEKLVWKIKADDVYDAHSGDIMKPVVKSIEQLLNESNISLTIINYSYNLICSTPGQLAWISKLKWAELHKLNETHRWPIWENYHLQGYYKNIENFSYYAVNGGSPESTEANYEPLKYVLRMVTNFG